MTNVFATRNPKPLNKTTDELEAWIAAHPRSLVVAVLDANTKEKLTTDGLTINGTTIRPTIRPTTHKPADRGNDRVHRPIDLVSLLSHMPIATTRGAIESAMDALGDGTKYTLQPMPEINLGARSLWRIEWANSAAGATANKNLRALKHVMVGNAWAMVSTNLGEMHKAVKALRTHSLVLNNLPRDTTDRTLRPTIAQIPGVNHSFVHFARGGEGLTRATVCLLLARRRRRGGPSATRLYEGQQAALVGAHAAPLQHVLAPRPPSIGLPDRHRPHTTQGHHGRCQQVPCWIDGGIRGLSAYIYL
ncbi:hypothetical protein BCR44DRAFT_1141943 [Catenaria anguillulae PL171]|uniref:Uncharacterized protein n=1 Tax=Catenaria anguillulae PL171 TaxID=765915 RepID=A0A1Y2H3Y1_9FUNG|nr:hypothetical protein BCR44DRAFT_1141943 [Catenaria anguillulae PL171]